MIILGSNFKTFAVNTSDTDYLKDGYECYQIDFQDVDIYQHNSSSVENINNNITEAVTFIKSLNLNEKGCIGLEDAYLSELRTLEEQGVILKSYAVYIPEPDTSFGSYDGYKFKASYSKYNESYASNKSQLEGKENNNRWLKGLVDIGMCFTNYKVSLPYALFFSVFDSNASYYDGSFTTIVAEDDVTSRFIWIQDLDQRMSLNKNEYVLVLNDMSRYSKLTVDTYYNSPYIERDTSIKYKTFTTPGYNDKATVMDRGLRYYITSDLIAYVDYTFSFVKFEWISNA